MSNIDSGNPEMAVTSTNSPTHGRLALLASAFVLLFAGLFALYVGLTGQFLPHDEKFLGMTSEALCAVHGCRVVHFMVHDRVSFGGTLVAIGLLYLWLVEGPLRDGQAWAWWLLVASGAVGFGSFLTYLSYGYLDSWHGAATLGLLPCFAFGVVRSRRTLAPPEGVRCLLRRSDRWPRLGRACLLGTAVGMLGGGLTILVLGSTRVFVPTDLVYMGVGVDELQALNPRLVPLIAHDRAGFGGAVCLYVHFTRGFTSGVSSFGESRGGLSVW